MPTRQVHALNINNMCVSADRLLVLERELRYKRQLADADVFPDARNWDYIISNAMEALAPELYRKYLLAWITPEQQRSDYHELALTRYPDYVDVIDRETALETIYCNVTSAPDATLNLVEVCRLFDARWLMQLIENDVDVHFVAQCLTAFQPEYDQTDVQDMTRLLNTMRSLPIVGGVKESFSIFGSERRFVCPEGHEGPVRKTDDGDYYCSVCGRNTQGLTESDVDAINVLATRIALLRSELYK